MHVPLLYVEKVGWVEYVPLVDLPDAILIRIMTCLCWEDVARLQTVHTKFRWLPHLTAFGPLYQQRWGSNYSNPCAICGHVFYTAWHNQVHGFYAHNHVLSYAQLQEFGAIIKKYLCGHYPEDLLLTPGQWF